jgi:hypothetical protein
VGRLDEIIERNRHPRRAMRKRKGLGVGLASVVLFVVLILLIFTDLAKPPDDPPPPPPSGEHRIRDVRLGTGRPKAPGSGSAVGSGSAAPAPIAPKP